MVVKMRMNILYFSFVTIFTCCIMESAANMWCYSCNYTRTPKKTGTECLTEPWNVTGPSNVTVPSTVNCSNPDKCTTLRVYQHSIQELYSFHRGCTPDKGNRCERDNNFETCYTSCDSDYCNDGDGVPVTKPTKPPGTLMCYTCTLQSDIASNTTNCVKQPWNLTLPHHETVCEPPKMCTIERLYMHSREEMRTFTRGCTDYKVNECRKHALFEACSTSCWTDYCNYGDGIPFVSGGTKTKTHFIGITISLGVLRQYLFNLPHF